MRGLDDGRVQEVGKERREEEAVDVVGGHEGEHARPVGEEGGEVPRFAGEVVEAMRASLRLPGGSGRREAHARAGPGHRARDDVDPFAEAFGAHDGILLPRFEEVEHLAGGRGQPQRFQRVAAEVAGRAAGDPRVLVPGLARWHTPILIGRGQVAPSATPTARRRQLRPHHVLEDPRERAAVRGRAHRVHAAMSAPSGMSAPWGNATRLRPARLAA